MEIDSGMTKDGRISISASLEKLLADTYLLYLKTQNVHWNITGPEFYSLHILTEKQYEELAEAVDEIAERIRALGFYVEGTTKAFQKLSSIQEDEKIHPKHEHIEQLIKGHEVIMHDLRKLGKLAESENDHATVDLIGRRLLFHEKAAWMLRSQIL